VAKRRLDNAIKATKGVEVEITWHPYMIDPSCDPKGEPYMAYMKRRWGGDGWVTGLKESGAPDGVLFGDWKTWPHTFLAHRLLTHTLDKYGCNKQHLLKEILFQRLYERGENISDPEILLKAATEAKVEEGAKEAINGPESDALGKKTAVEDYVAKSDLGISSVPTFVLPGNVRMSGAQPTSVFKKIIDALANGESLV